jgi:hypothetical protein
MFTVNVLSFFCFVVVVFFVVANAFDFKIIKFKVVLIKLIFKRCCFFLFVFQFHCIFNEMPKNHTLFQYIFMCVCNNKESLKFAHTPPHTCTLLNAN